MRFALVPLALAFPLSAPLSAASPSPAITSADPAGAAQAGVAAGDPAVLKRLLDNGLRVGDPFPVRGAKAPPPSDANAAKARSVARLAAAAQARALDTAPDVVAAVAAVRQILLAEKLMQSLSDAVVIDDAEIRRRFDASPDRYDEFALAHIFLSSAPRAGVGEARGSEAGGKQAALERARAAQARLKAGEDFAVVASSMSDDRSSAVEGGDLPPLLGDSIQPMFLATVRTMKEGEVSGIVEGDEGYHLIKLVRRQHAWSGPARELIEREVRSEEMRKLLPELRRIEETAG